MKTILQKFYLKLSFLCLLLIFSNWDLQAQLTRYRDAGKVGLTTSSGNIIVQPQYDAISDFYEGLAVVMKGMKYGFIDENGEVVIPLMYDDAGHFSEGRARVMINGLYGFIDTSNLVVIECRFINAGNFENGFARVCDGKLWYQMDLDGNFAGDGPFEVIKSFSNGRAVASKNGLYGYIDHTGKWLLQPQYTFAGMFQPDDRAGVMLNGKYVWINRDGEVIGQIPTIEQVEHGEVRD